MRRRIDITYLWLAVIAALAVSVTSCSTTRRLGADDVLYTGVKKIDIVPSEGEKVPSGVAEEVKNAVNVRPNNSLSWLSPYYRYPFPLGLWVYNNWSNPPKGFKHWLYEKLVDRRLIERIHADNFISYYIINVAYSLKHALSQISRRVSVSEFYRLKCAC